MTNLLNEIKSKGYWRINFRPLIDEKIISDLSQTKELIKKHHVELRGWDYPYYPLRSDSQGNLKIYNNFCEGYSDWEDMKEVWRFYESGQFIHYLALREDWERSDFTKTQEKPCLEVSSTIYQLVEIFEFASRLAAKTDIYKNGININIQIFKTKNRKLHLFNGSLPGEFTGSNEENISCFNTTLTTAELISNPDKCAAQAAKKTFSLFGFERSDGYIKSHQKKIRKGL